MCYNVVIYIRNVCTIYPQVKKVEGKICPLRIYKLWQILTFLLYRKISLEMHENMEFSGQREQWQAFGFLCNSQVLVK